MRLWSLHPKYLDTKGLIACWRESLLAKKVLEGKTKGYKFHPQLERFKVHPEPIHAIDLYLSVLYEEAAKRGFIFNRTKLNPGTAASKISVPSGQIMFELGHLMKKLWRRDRKKYFALRRIKAPECNPLFSIIDGEKESWERDI